MLDARSANLQNQQIIVEKRWMDYPCQLNYTFFFPLTRMNREMNNGTVLSVGAGIGHGART